MKIRGETSNGTHTQFDLGFIAGAQKEREQMLLDIIALMGERAGMKFIERLYKRRFPEVAE